MRELSFSELVKGMKVHDTENNPLEVVSIHNDKSVTVKVLNNVGGYLIYDYNKERLRSDVLMPN